jgi:hypothetical protein
VLRVVLHLSFFKPFQNLSEVAEVCPAFVSDIRDPLRNIDGRVGVLTEGGEDVLTF